jgi:sensitive to high expression protein 9
VVLSELNQTEKQMQTLREVVRSAKAAYDEAVSIRAVSQSSVNSLLERKHAWTDSDVSRFATLVRADHTSNLAVANSSAALAEAELAADKAFSELMQAILRRYHEEQVWSDKIRSVSTYANLVGLVINLVVFLGAVAVVEPWKRRKLVQKLEKRTGGMMERVEKEIGGLKGQIAVLVAAREGVSAQGSEPPLDLSIPAIEEATPEAQLPSGSSPRWSASFPNLLPSLDFIASPSHERDLAAVSACSLAAGIVLTQIARAVFG